MQDDKVVSTEDAKKVLNGLGLGIGGMAVLSALFPIGIPLITAATALSKMGLFDNDGEKQEKIEPLPLNDDKSSLFFQRIASDVRCIAGKTLSEVASSLGLTKQAILKWETKVVNPETGELSGFHAKLSKPNYFALLHYYSLCCTQQPDNVALQTLVPFVCKYIPNPATDDEVEDLITCIAKHKKVDLPINHALLEKLNGYLK